MWLLWDLLMVRVVAVPLPSALLGTISITYTSPKSASISMNVELMSVTLKAMEEALLTVMK